MVSAIMAKFSFGVVRSFLHMQQPRLAEDGHHRRFCVDQQLHLRIIFGINLFRRVDPKAAI